MRVADAEFPRYIVHVHYDSRIFFPHFSFFSLSACSRYSGIPETFALFMRVRLKPRSAVYHLNEKY